MERVKKFAVYRKNAGTQALGLRKVSIVVSSKCFLQNFW